MMRYVKVFRSLSKFVLHPLIHTSARTPLGTRCGFLPNALLAHLAQQLIAKNGGRIQDLLPASGPRLRGGLPPFANPGLREIIFVDSRSSYGEDRLGRSGAFKRSYRWGIRRYWSREDRGL